MKIFVTVGTQLPFDRLVRAMDDWAFRNPGHDVFAQTGDGSVAPTAIRSVRSLSRADFLEAVAEADVVVAHAGIGSVLTALDAGKRVILMPRRADLGEHRNDHQAATAAELSRLATVTIVEDCEALAEALCRAAEESGPAGIAAPGVASDGLLAAVAGFIADGDIRGLASPPRVFGGVPGYA